MEMKKFVMIFAAMVTLASCGKNDQVEFDEAFAYLSLEDGSSSQNIPWNSNGNLQTYYVNFVTPARKDAVSFSYVITTDLVEGLDYRKIATTSSPLTFQPGIYQMPIRIEWLRNPLDASASNTLTIELTECSDAGVRLGKPGPAERGRKFVITKY
jgi:hypothetical protein